MKNLKDAAELSMEKWMETIPDDIPEAEFSPEHEKEMQKISGTAKKKKIAVKTVIRIAVAATLAVVLAVVGVYGDTGVNEYTVTSVYGRLTYTVNDPYDGKVKEDVVVGYIPENFSLTEEIFDDSRAQKVYKDPCNDYNDLIIVKQPSDTGADLGFKNDIEKYYTVKKGRFEYVVSYSEAYTIIVRNDETYIYIVHATNSGLSEDELLKIAYNVK